ncbi:diaminobutyrate acetyltransferase [Paenibacillus cellulosilyticus]|nr:diaminobutyrate acetyltransferase [Paenibacillus cellulosilyticus]
MPANQSVLIRKPSAEDGAKVWELVKHAEVLDVNSAYSYIMLCDLFRGTCAVAEQNGKIVGFVSSFHPSERENTLFIWQIAVAKSHRGQGIGISLLKELLERDENSEVRTIETTISPSNTPSKSLFGRLAKELGSTIEQYNGYSSNLFPEGAHEEEKWIRIQLRS